MATIFNLNMNNNNENFDLSVNDSVENFVVEFGEITYLTNKDFNKLDNRPSYNNQTMNGDTNIPKVPTAVSELDNDSDYQTGAEVEAALATKQDILTAGDNIDITNNVISATDTTYSAGNGLNLSSENAFSVDTTIVATQQGLSDEVTNRENADIALQAQIDGISASSDVVDIVGTYAELEDYDTSKLKDNDIIKVLQDSTQNNATTYYRWSTSSGTFTLIGQEGPYYTKAAAEAQFVPQTRTVNGKALSSNITLNASDVSALSPNDVVQTTGSSTTQIMSQKAVTDQLATKLNVSDYVVDTALADSTNPVQNKVLNNLLGDMPTDFFTANATVAGEGTNITLNKTMSAPIKLNVLKGDTYQQTYSGKNQLSYTLTSLQSINTNGTWTNNVYVYNGITYTVNDDLTINVNGSTQANAPSYFVINNSLSLVSSTSYIINGCPTGGGVQSYSIRLYDSGTYTSDVGSGVTFTYGTQNIVRINIFGGITVTNKLFKPMIRLATVTDDTYEPYCGGIPSPDPSYPQDIQVVTGEQTVNVHGKNLFDSYIATKASWQSGDITVNSDGSISLSNNTGTNNYFQLNQTLGDLCPSLSAGDEVYLYLDTTAREIIYPGVIWNKGDKKTITQTMLDTNLVIYGGYNQTDTLKIMITKDQATDYEPYQSKDYKVHLTSKNLFDGAFAQGTWYSAGVLNSVYNRDVIKLIIGQTYTISKKGDTDNLFRFAVNTASQPLYSGCAISTLGWDSGWQTGDSYTFIAQNEYLGIPVSFCNDSNISPSDINNLSFQLELGTATEYEEYYDYKLCKIGTYQDYIYKSGDDWYVHKETGNSILKGTEDWYLGQNLTNTSHFIIADFTTIFTGAAVPPNNTTLGYCLSDHFEEKANLYNIDQVGIDFHSNKNLIVSVPNSISTITANFKTWLVSNNTVVYYRLATPTYTKITDTTLISELNALQAAKSYLDTTYFLTTANGTNLATILDLEAYTKSLNGILGYIGDN